MRIIQALALAVALAAYPFAAKAEAAGCGSAPILAMTYNVRLDTPADGPNAWDHRKAFFIGQVATLRPDLLGMQEVLPNQKRDIAAGLPGYTLIGGGRDDGRDAGEASPLAVNLGAFRLGKRGMFWLSPTPDRPSLGWDAGYRRVVSWVHVSRRSDGAKILAVNTHWDHQGLEARRKSGAMLQRWIAANLGKGERLIVLGDFNAELGEESLIRLVQGAGLRNAREVAGSASFGPAFSFNDFRPFAREGKLIDHILVGPQIAVRHHGVIAATENGRVASDHFPVVALLETGKAGSCGQRPAP